MLAVAVACVGSLVTTTTLARMSALARDAAAFKSSMKKTDFTSWHSNSTLKTKANSGASSTESAAAAASGSATDQPKKKKIKQSQNHIVLQCNVEC